MISQIPPKIAKLFVCYQATAIAINEAPSRGPLLQLLHGTIAVCSDQKAWEVVHCLGPLSPTVEIPKIEMHISDPGPLQKPICLWEPMCY